MHQLVEKTYKKVTQIEHILLRPSLYIGSTEEAEENVWVLEDEQLVLKKTKYVPGLYKIFDEIVVNAADNYQRDKKMSKLEVHIGKEQISVRNDGKGIPVQIHKLHKVYVPELIFGHLLTSSNYDDSEKKVAGGRNGYGAKLANLFSISFMIEAADSANKKLFSLTWSHNMSQMGEPVIVPYSGPDYTKITFRPDFKRFGMSKFSPDMMGLLKKRVYDLAGILKVKVYLNCQLVQLSSFKEYVRMYMEDPSQPLAETATKNGRWQVLACRSQGQFRQVSFVNSIATTKGGSHVAYILEQVTDKVIAAITKKGSKGGPVKAFQVKPHLQIFINCLIETPSFDSQTKVTLITNPKDFGSACLVSDEFVKELLKSGIGERVLQDIRAKESNKIDRELKKVKRNRLLIPKLEDANEAGRSNKCCLILTEGDSAKTLALCGLEELGRDFFGVYPLKGKPANVRTMTPKQVMQNQELSSIVKIFGLAFEKEYTCTSSLRYSSVMIMADQDHDGSHIKGLVINFFEHFWPSLCRVRGFLKEFITPIIKARKGGSSLNFYSQVDYNKWRAANESGWSIKYYKGLGTSTQKEAKEYFSQLGEHEIRFVYSSQQDHDVLELAFDKKNADLRKQWLQGFDPEVGVDHRVKQMSVEDFVNKELVHFSNSDNIRSLPSAVDGLKPSQRKILFACFKRNLTSEMKVAQLAGYVAEHSAYHHGEASLCATIVSMAQTFVGSNNLNLLEPSGQFGTRYENGKDAASARYIFTKLSPIARYLFKEEDDHVVDYQEEENQTIEPSFYLPILPLVLINGAEGIGTGWSTLVYPHQVAQVISLTRDRINGKRTEGMIGWQNFQGSVERGSNGGFVAKGSYEVEGERVTIREIPVKQSIRDYKHFLQEKLQSEENQDPELEELREYHQDGRIEFVIRFAGEKMPDEGELLKYLRLTANYQLNNMHLFSGQRTIRRYEHVSQILDEFYEQRLDGYSRRKKYLISKFRKESDILANQTRFIQQVMEGSFQLTQSKQDWVFKLAHGGYQRYQQLNKVESTKNREEDENERNSDFNYLLTMPIWSFCQEKVHEMTSVQSELTTVILHYQAISEQQLWLADIDSFQTAWLAQQVRQTTTRTTAQLLSQHSQHSQHRKRVRPTPSSQSVGSEPASEPGAPTRRQRSLNKSPVEEQLFGGKGGGEGRKRAKEDQPVDNKLAPLSGEGKGQQQKGAGIESILQKYLCQDTHRGELSLLERIKHRITGGDPTFNASYHSAKEQLKDLPVQSLKRKQEGEKEQKEEKEQERRMDEDEEFEEDEEDDMDLRGYLL